jgi:hypothetical protein
MQQIFSYFHDFFQQINKPFLLFCTLLAAALVFANYKWGIETRVLNSLPGRPAKFAGFYLLYLLAFCIPYAFWYFTVQPVAVSGFPVLLLLLAPAIFALKVSAGGWQDLIRAALPGNEGRFFAIVIDWPLRLVLTVSLLLLIRPVLPATDHFYGLQSRQFHWAPYLALLGLVIPLVVFAANQPAFLASYPKLKTLQFLAPGGPSAFQKILFELSYGSDFFTIELFFRGFLVVVFAKYAGPAAILPMAVFYCSIHFGKPLLECISSYFGGILLGVIACYTQSIWGGIIVHLGLAWIMELAAFLSSKIISH